MREYRRLNSKYIIHGVLLSGIGFDIKISDIDVTLRLYSDNPIYDYNNIGYRGYVCFRVGTNGDECAIYYNYWWDCDTKRLEYNAVIVNNDGVQIGKVD